MRARTKLACEMASFDPKKLNEMIAEGVYTCAPATTPGVARIFETHDILTLRIFGSMLGLTASRERANAMAREARGLLESDKTSSRLTKIVHFEKAPGMWDTVGRYEGDKDDGPAIGITWDISHLRSKIITRFEHEEQNRVYGDD